MTEHEWVDRVVLPFLESVRNPKAEIEFYRGWAHAILLEKKDMLNEVPR